jgi:hypothetical protein
VLYEEREAASAVKLAAEKAEEAMDEAYTRVGTHVTRDARLVPALGSPSSAAGAGADASASLVVRCH